MLQETTNISISELQTLQNEVFISYQQNDIVVSENEWLLLNQPPPPPNLQLSSHEQIPSGPCWLYEPGLPLPACNPCVGLDDY
jgi:hypothetical protein